MNNVLLVGRLSQEPVFETSENGYKRTVIHLAVNRGYKNSEGKYDTDFIKVVLWNGMASATKDYCHTGDVVGIKGRLQVNVFDDNEVKRKVLEVVADKITFISPSIKKSVSKDESDTSLEECY